MSAMEAAQRAQYVLGKWKYRSWGIPGGVRFERGFAGSALVVIRAHHVHATIDLLLQDLGEEKCQVSIDQKVMKLGQPSTNLDKIVWLGDVEDVEAMLLRREEPKLDRIREDDYAGKVSLKYICFAVIPPLVAALWLYIIGNLVGAIIAGLLTLVTIPILPKLPFRMPHFPIENQVPPPPFESNYIRNRN